MWHGRSKQRWRRSRIGAVLEAASAEPTGADEAERWPMVALLAAFLALFGLMTWPWIVGQATVPWDAKAHFQPQIQFLADSLARGEWPWWNPFVFSGQPQVADPQSMIFSPPFLLLALFDKAPGLWAADMTVLASMAVGGLGLIVWFRDRGWHGAGALVAAIAFSFGAAMGWRLQHTGQVLSLSYLPWALVFLERAIGRGSLVAGLMSGVVAACIVLGRDQVALLCVYLLAARAVWLWSAAAPRWASVRRSLLPLTAGGLAGLAIIAIPVLMTVMLAADSNRPAIDLEGAGRGSLHPALLITFLAPQLFGAAGAMADYWGPPSFAWNDTGLYTAQNVGQLYIGAAPALLILLGALSGRLWAREVRFFTLAFLIMGLYALGWYTPVFRGLYSLLPGVDLYRRPADAVFLIGGLGAILAGYVTHTLFVRPWPGLPRTAVLGTIAVLVAALIVAVVLGVRLDRVGRLPVPLAMAVAAFALSGLALVFATRRIVVAPVQAAAALAALTAADVGWNNGPTTSSALPPAHYEVLEPDSRNATIAALKARVVADATRRDRVELAGLGFHWPNASMTHRLENTLGYNPVRLGLYSRATGAEDHVGLPDQRKFSALMPSYRSLLADMLGLRFIAAGAPIETIDKSLAPGALPLVARTREAYIYERTTALPRVLFVPAAQGADFAAILDTGRWPDFDPRATVLLEGTAPAAASRQPGQVRIVRYEGARVVVEADGPGGGYVLLNDVWHPWWFADIDGRSAPVLRANVLFRAVAVPPGRHVVTFTFRPLDGLWADLKLRSTSTRP